NPTVVWDSSFYPTDATLDIALIQEGRQHPIFLRRYVLSHLGSTVVNLNTETISPGTYTLLLTIFEGRSSFVLGRSEVANLLIVSDEYEDGEDEQENDSNQNIKEIIKNDDGSIIIHNDEYHQEQGPESAPAIQEQIYQDE